MARFIGVSTLELSSGRLIHDVDLGIGLSYDGVAVLGADENLERKEDRLTKAERAELAELMILRWREYAND